MKTKPPKQSRPAKEPKLTDKQAAFISEYLKDLNATQAAIRAGYSKKTAYEIGHENRKHPRIRAAIDAKLKELALSAEETIKSISDIAKSSMNDYFNIREEVRCPRITKKLSDVILDLEQAIEDADEFIRRAKIRNKEALDLHKAEQESRRQEIIRLEIELERNPNAIRIVSGPPEIVKVAELDLARLVQDKEAGRIKSIKPTEFGLNVELYPADGALRDMARYHGLFEKDNNQQSQKIIVTRK